MSEVSTKDKKTFLHILKTVLIFASLVLFIRASIFEPYKIPSGSMRPTLEIGDMIIVTKFNYSFRLPFFKEAIWQYSKPERGDIVVFSKPYPEEYTRKTTGFMDYLKQTFGRIKYFLSFQDKNIIKRVIGLAGDTIEVKRGHILINGKDYPESYSVWLNGGIGEFGPYKVPEGRIFLLGDNRDNSKDSRFWDDPFLPITMVKGEAQFIYWNMGAMHRVGKIIR